MYILFGFCGSKIEYKTACLFPFIIKNFSISDLQSDCLDPSEELNDAVIESIELETKAIIATQENNYAEALNLFAKAIEVAPLRASVFNNRAQTMRLLNDDAGKQYLKLQNNLK